MLVTASVCGIDREDFASCGTISNSANCDDLQYLARNKCAFCGSAPDLSGRPGSLANLV